VLRDYRTAPVSEKLRATLAFLEKMTLQPEALSPSDAQRARDAGASDAELTEAAWVAAAFNVIDRLADAMGFDLQTPQGAKKGALALLKFGYRL
jgi:alkylhydroperoxidase family enzyme